MPSIKADLGGLTVDRPPPISSLRLSVVTGAVEAHLRCRRCPLIVIVSPRSSQPAVALIRMVSTIERWMARRNLRSGRCRITSPLKEGCNIKI